MTSKPHKAVEAPHWPPRTPLPVERFRHVLGHVPTAIVVVTAIHEGKPVGLTVGTFTSVSLEPPLVGFLPAVSSTSFSRVRASGVFCANVLTVDQKDTCRDFAVSGGDKFAHLRWQPSRVTGSPIIDGAAAWIDCRITTVTRACDHFVVIGDVVDLEAMSGTPPLVFHRGQITLPAYTQTVNVEPESAAG
jgi:3-hydroxy-9,10-secoandrosta-1,3,5(10)-triene-9,17-dione monooxygenase reductase component